MPKYKLVAIDMDDTLLTTKLEISPRVKDAIRKAKELGVHVTLATGRMYASARPFAEDLGLNIPLITYQGAYVKDCLTNELLSYKPIKLEFAREIIKHVQKGNSHVNIYLDDQVEDKIYVEEINDKVMIYVNQSKVHPHPVGDLLDFLDRDPLKVLVMDEEKKLDRLAEEIREKLGDEVYITKSKPYYLEFLNPHANKADALESLAQRYGIEREETMAIGDSYNDMEMIQYAGLGVVMGNARAEIKALADYVTYSNDEDGVAEALEKFIFPVS